VLALGGGFLNLPPSLGGHLLVERLLEPVFGAAAGRPEVPLALEQRLHLISEAAALAGVLLSWLLYMRFRPQAAAIVERPVGRAVRDYWLAGWGFDWLYGMVFVRPYRWLAQVNRGDVVDCLPAGLGWFATAVHRLLSRAQTGEVRWYVAVLVFGTVLLITIVVLR
jgi:NADH-quinone oxidoreductase subunit L